MGKIRFSRNGRETILGDSTGIQFFQPPAAGGTWNQFQFDTFNSGYNPNGGPEGGSLTRDVVVDDIGDFDVGNIPVTDGERVYFNNDGTTQPVTFIASTLDGSGVLQETQLNTGLTHPNSIVIQEDFLYTLAAADIGGRIFRLDRESGAVVDSSDDVIGTFEFIPYSVSEGSIIQSSSSTDKVTPSEFSSTEIISDGSTEFATTEDAVFILKSGGFSEEKLIKYNKDGSLEAEYDFDTVLTNDLCINTDGSVIVVKGQLNDLSIKRLGLNTSDLSEIWRTDLAGQSNDIPGPAYKDGVAYIAGFQPESAIYAIDIQTGAELWRNNEVNFPTVPPAVTDGNLYVPDQNELKIFDPESGTLKQIVGSAYEGNFGGMCVTEEAVFLPDVSNSEMGVVR